MSASGLDSLPLNPNEPAAKVLAVISHSFEKGGQTAQETLRIQNDALKQALEQNATLADRVVKMADFVTKAAHQSAETARVAADRDVELAKVKADADFYSKLEGFATGPVGMAILGKLGFVPSLPPEKRRAVCAVLERFFAHPETCSSVQAENPADYAHFLEFIQVLAG